MISFLVKAVNILMLIIMLLFTLEIFMALKINIREGNSRQKEEIRYEKERIRNKQIILMLLFNFLAYLFMWLVKRQMEIAMVYFGVTVYILLVPLLYSVLYKNASGVLVNAMCMLLSVGFVIQTRLGIDYAIKQLLIVSVSTAFSIIIPVIVKRARFISRITWIFAGVGIVLLTAVLLLSKVTGGANLSIQIGGITFQFSEFVKITYVFFIAGMLQDLDNLKKLKMGKERFRHIVIATVVAAIHVIILVLSKDLGAALIYFMAYVVMVYVATRNVGYAFLGLGGMGAASVVAYKLFSHIRVRFQVWRDPFADYQGTGYQIVQALFGVCAGGWFGTGLFQGAPEMIPLARVDFTYAAICEELGVLFGICLILLCMSMYLMIVNISMTLKKPFYKLIAIGLGTEYCFQVFLTIGGTTKFIPMTGVTLPLVSYGGSSVMCTIIMLSIIQGLYILRENEVQTERAGHDEGRLETSYYDGRYEDAWEEQNRQAAERLIREEQIRRQRLEEQRRRNEEERRRVEQSGVPKDLEQRIQEETEKSIHW